MLELVVWGSDDFCFVDILLVGVLVVVCELL